MVFKCIWTCVSANYLPDMGGLPMYMLRLACDVDWESEQACFKTFCKETAHFYSKLPRPSENVRIIIVEILC